MPVLIVQHMPPMFTASSPSICGPDRLVRPASPRTASRSSPAPSTSRRAGVTWGCSLGLGDPVIRLDDGPPVNFCRPAVDVLFRDAAAIFGAAALAVVLTGMGSDGTQGARARRRPAPP